MSSLANFHAWVGSDERDVFTPDPLPGPTLALDFVAAIAVVYLLLKGIKRVSLPR